MSKTQKNVGKKTFKKVAKKKVSKPSKKTGLKKKVVSMKLKRKVKKVHRKKMKRGGAKYLSGQTDLGKIWNTILLKKNMYYLLLICKMIFLMQLINARVV